MALDEMPGAVSMQGNVTEDTPKSLIPARADLSKRSREVQEEDLRLAGKLVALRVDDGDEVQSKRHHKMHLPNEILWTIFSYALPPTDFLDPGLYGGPDSPWSLTLRS
ncbi:hypothetical protein PLICRDRAFT_35321 [Plicaturopsis crispa FD-325 SS-3]|nr:hypothetical protein PLICRDRAFT_35321 [Plicaturopsis crispa FD-325 SS-3]